MVVVSQVNIYKCLTLSLISFLFVIQLEKMETLSKLVSELSNRIERLEHDGSQRSGRQTHGNNHRVTQNTAAGSAVGSVAGSGVNDSSVSHSNNRDDGILDTSLTQTLGT